MINDLKTLLILVSVSYILYKWYTSTKNLPPGPISWPFIGYLGIDTKYPYESLMTLAKKYGPIYGLKMGNIYTIVISDAAIVRETLKLDVFTGRAPLYLTHGIMGGYGIICAEGDLWYDQRKLCIEWLKKMGMAKYSSNRKLLEERIMNGVNVFVKSISESTAIKTNNAYEMDPTKSLYHTIGNIMNDIVFGITYAEDDKIWQYLQSLQEQGVKYIGVSGIVNFLPILRYLPQNKKIIEFLLNGKAVTHQIYDRIIKNIQNNVIDSDDDDDDDDGNSINNSNKNNDNININNKYVTPESDEFTFNGNTSIAELFLIERKQRTDKNDINKLGFLSDIQMKHLLADIFGAGLDTTLTTLRWFLLYIAQNKNYQEKIRKEMQSKLSDHHSPSVNDYNELNYLKACIAETQRIRSVVPIGIPHGSIKESFLHGYRIPKNSMIIPLQWAIHMDSNVWPDPNEFKPERFLNENEEFYMPQQFLPFQTGKRMCIGDDLAKMILFLYTSTILYNFNVTIAEFPIDMKGECGITLSPYKYRLRFIKNH